MEGGEGSNQGRRLERGEGSNQNQGGRSYTNAESTSSASAGAASNAEEERVHPANANASARANSAIPYRRDSDQLMPAANINRIMRRILPQHAKISEDAKYLVQECVSEYVSFITNEANERCHREHRKTINAEDLLYAHSSLGFDTYVAPLTTFLNRYRHNQQTAQTAVHGDPSVAAQQAPPPPPQLPIVSAPPPDDPVNYGQVQDGVFDQAQAAALNEYCYLIQTALARHRTGSDPGGGQSGSSSNAPFGDDDGQSNK